jgi:nucleoside diphosphate kinase
MLGHVNVRFTLAFDCPEEVLEIRLLNRAKTSGRADDNKETIMKRFKTFQNESMPVITRLKEEGTCVTIPSINGPDIVYNDAKKNMLAMGHPLPSNDVETTFAFFKPELLRMNCQEAALKRIKDAGFKIALQKQFTLDKATAEAFYAEHKGKPFFDPLVARMTKSDVVALALQRVNAVNGWRELAGPTNSIKARVVAPNSLRACFGIDGSENGFHGSDSKASANRELTLIFGQEQVNNLKLLNAKHSPKNFILCGAPASGKVSDNNRQVESFV